MYSVYLIQARNSSVNYVGATKNVFHRLELHNKNQGARFLRGKGPFELVAYVSGFKRWRDALAFEKRVKKVSMVRRIMETSINLRLRKLAKVYDPHVEKLRFHLSRNWAYFESIHVPVYSMFDA